MPPAKAIMIAASTERTSGNRLRRAGAAAAPTGRPSPPKVKSVGDGGDQTGAVEAGSGGGGGVCAAFGQPCCVGCQPWGEPDGEYGGQPACGDCQALGAGGYEPGAGDQP